MKLPALVPSFCLIGMLTSAPPSPAQQRSRLNGHPVVLDSQGKLLSWVEPQERAYDRIVRLGWGFILNKVVTGNEPAGDRQVGTAGRSVTAKWRRAPRRKGSEGKPCGACWFRDPLCRL
jgi:hypothetical protein